MTLPLDTFPRSVWEPTRNADGEIIFPLRFYCRPVTSEDVARRRRGELQDWQKEIGRKSVFQRLPHNPSRTKRR